MTKKVVVLMGGLSSEREVSLASGANVSAALKQAGYDVFDYDLTRDLRSFIDMIETQKPDAVFNALHGKYGEDGCVQGILDIMGVPYTHSGRMASALAMNKAAAKKMYGRSARRGGSSGHEGTDSGRRRSALSLCFETRLRRIVRRRVHFQS